MVPPERSFVIGRDESVDLQIINAMVSRRHLLLQPAGHSWQLIDQSRNGTFVNGQRITRAAISPQDVVVRTPAGKQLLGK